MDCRNKPWGAFTGARREGTFRQGAVSRRAEAGVIHPGEQDLGRSKKRKENERPTRRGDVTSRRRRLSRSRRVTRGNNAEELVRVGISYREGAERLYASPSGDRRPKS